MKRFMEMFENIMVEIAFAEEGISPAALQPQTVEYSDLGEQTWDLR